MDHGKHFDKLKKILQTKTVGALNALPQLEIALCRLSIHRLVSAWHMLARGLAVLRRVHGKQISTRFLDLREQIKHISERDI